jgi:hypothetical protein
MLFSGVCSNYVGIFSPLIGLQDDEKIDINYSEGDGLRFIFFLADIFSPDWHFFDNFFDS